MVDFSVVYEELKDKYSSTLGRTYEDVVKMFKYFLGYFSDVTKFINSSLLTVFCRERLKDEDENLMDKFIQKTVELTLEKGIIEVKSKIIVDLTHTYAMYSHISPREELIRRAKSLRKSIYQIDESMHDKMPKKREATGLLEDQIEYTKELLDVLKEDGRFFLNSWN